MSSGAKIAQPRQHAVLECGAERFAAVAGPQRRVDHGIVVAGLATAPVPGNSGIWWVEQYITVLSAQKISCEPLP